MAEYMVIARKYRPQQFDDIVGQEHVRTTLINAIKTQRVAHAYLFSGPRGIGKTTIARILAKALNCTHGPTPTPCDKCTQCLEIIKSNSMDVIEIDGASNRGIDEIRELRENVKFSPSGSKFKVYIIDEVHMLTTEAFNALLKTLEEPPSHVKFFFATTEPNKVPETISSRCQRFELHRIRNSQIEERLKKISQKEKIKIKPNSLNIIARCGNGSMRDAESLLDKLIAYCGNEIKHDEVLGILGIVDTEVLFEISESIIQSNVGRILNITTEIFEQGKNLQQFLLDLTNHFRNILLCQYSPDLHKQIELPKEDIDRIIQISKSYTKTQLIDILNILTKLQGELKWSLSKRIALEIGIIKIAQAGKRLSLDGLVEKLEDLEKRLSNPDIEHVSVKKETNSNPVSDQKIDPDPTTLHIKEPASEYKAKNSQKKTVNTNLDQINNHWTEILNSLGKRNPLLKSYLAEGTPISFENNTLKIGFDPSCSLHYEAAGEKHNREIIEKRFEERLDKAIKLDFILTAPKEIQKKAKTKPVHNPLVEKVRSKFGAKIISIQSS